MKAFLIVKKLHSNKKDKDYLTCILNLGGEEFYLNLDKLALSILLDLKSRELAELPTGYVSKEYSIDLGD